MNLGNVSYGHQLVWNLLDRISNAWSKLSKFMLTLVLFKYLYVCIVFSNLKQELQKKDESELKKVLVNIYVAERAHPEVTHN